MKYKYELSLWKCQCSCGKEKIILGDNLKRGHTLSCGCYNKEILAKIISKTGGLHVTHKHSSNGRFTKEYITWCGMKRRCYTPKHTSYKDYGGRGITVCNEWKDSFETFLQYLKDNSMYEDAMTKGLSIDRYPNNNGNYEPGNIKISNIKEQNNNRRKKRYL